MDLKEIAREVACYLNPSPTPTMRTSYITVVQCHDYKIDIDPILLIRTQTLVSFHQFQIIFDKIAKGVRWRKNSISRKIGYSYKKYGLASYTKTKMNDKPKNKTVKLIEMI